MKKLFFIFLASLTILGCEKVIEIDIDDAEQQVVVEGQLRNFTGESYVLLSKSKNLYTTNDGFEKISGATVLISDADGNEYVFPEDPIEPGKYSLNSFAAVPNQTYFLTVDIGTQIITAESSSLNIPELDTLTYIETVGGFGGAGTDTSYLVFFNFQDDGSQTNYYRARPWVNGEKDNNLYITEDELFNGQSFSQPFFATSIGKKDTVLVELISMDKANYKYYFSLQSTNAGDFSAAPGNPVSNLEGENVVGYFGAYMIDTTTIILP